MKKTLATVLAVGASTLGVSSVGEAHTVQAPPPKVKQDRLKPLVKKMRPKVKHRGRNVIRHGRERDGRFTWNRLRRQYRYYWKQLHPPEDHTHYTPQATTVTQGAPTYVIQCESGGNPRAVNPAGYYGLYQFDLQTWQSVGGSGYPHHASPEEQHRRAAILYSQRGSNPWPVCG